MVMGMAGEMLTSRWNMPPTGAADNNQRQPTKTGAAGDDRHSQKENKSHLQTRHTQSSYTKIITTPAKGSHPGDKQRPVQRLQLLDTNHVTPLEVDIKIN